MTDSTSLSVKVVGEAEVIVEGLRVDVALADLELDAGVVVHVVDAHLLAEAVPRECTNQSHDSSQELADGPFLSDINTVDIA